MGAAGFARKQRGGRPYHRLWWTNWTLENRMDTSSSVGTAVKTKRQKTRKLAGWLYLTASR
jgi:hypothetical protein